MNVAIYYSDFSMCDPQVDLFCIKLLGAGIYSRNPIENVMDLIN